MSHRLLRTLLPIAVLLSGLACALSPGFSPASNPDTPDIAAATSIPFTPTATEPPLPTETPTASPTPFTPLIEVAIELVPLVTGIPQPLDVRHAGDGSGRLFVVSKPGVIYVVKDGALLPDPFLNIAGQVDSDSSERGLLGLAFHPDYASSGQFFVNYSMSGGDTVISRFTVSADNPDRADPASEQTLMVVDQPYANHNGGNLAFGPDGYLYIGLGDGGSGGDPDGNGQNGRTLLGSMLRIDVNTDVAYAIPPDNPFVGNPDVLDEIWAVGLRNPWRYTFDRETGDLYIADVGQQNYEEVNFVPADSRGALNFGWNVTEGLHCYQSSSGCDTSGFVIPVAEYSHEEGCSITGGYVYRGANHPSLWGVYFFGDYCSGRIWGLMRSADGNWQQQQLIQRDVAISSFGEDEAGELYVTDLSGGIVYQLVAVP